MTLLALASSRKCATNTKVEPWITGTQRSFFQGGGALGAYELGVVKVLYEARRHFKPTVATGVSIGAINAAILVGANENPLETLETFWCKRLTQVLPDPARTFSQPWITRPIE